MSVVIDNPTWRTHHPSTISEVSFQRIAALMNISFTGFINQLWPSTITKSGSSLTKTFTYIPRLLPSIPLTLYILLHTCDCETSYYNFNIILYVSICTSVYFLYAYVLVSIVLKFVCVCIFVYIFSTVHKLVDPLTIFYEKVNFLLNQRYHDFILSNWTVYNQNRYLKVL